MSAKWVRVHNRIRQFPIFLGGPSATWLNEGTTSAPMVVLVLLDAALDTIDHEILLHRLHNVFGFGNTVLSWFQSYLEN